MPIEGNRHLGPEQIPVIKNGKRITVNEDRLKPYNLDSAQKKVDSVGRTIAESRNIDSCLDQDSLDHLAEFVRAAEEFITAGRRESERLQARRSQIGSKDAASRYDEAINRLGMVIDRHIRMKSRLLNVLQRARAALAQSRREKRSAVPRKPADL